MVSPIPMPNFVGSDCDDGNGHPCPTKDGRCLGQRRGLGCPECVRLNSLPWTRLSLNRTFPRVRKLNHIRANNRAAQLRSCSCRCPAVVLPRQGGWEWTAVSEGKLLTQRISPSIGVGIAPLPQAITLPAAGSI
jgi:hypothetical protein